MQDAATEIAGLQQRHKLQMSSLSNIGKKAKGSNTYYTPRHITTSLQRWTLVTKQKFARPLDFDPSYQLPGQSGGPLTGEPSIMV
jgi:hypothetical protein